MADRSADVATRSASAPLTCADLFCGAGGFSEGFHQAGYRVTKALDIWAPAVLTHERNLPDTEAIRADILSFDPERIGPIDVLIGSPPCTEFSFANRGGGGDVEEGMLLVYRFLRFVYDLRPRWWVMENVPRVLDFLPDEIPLRKLGIDKKGALEIPVRAVLVSADYGAPQMRRRAFSGNFPLPTPTHAEGPRGQQLQWRTLRDVVETLPDPLRPPGGRPAKGGLPTADTRRNATSDVAVVRDPVYGFELPASELTDHFGDDVVLTEEEVRRNRKAKADHSWYGRMSFPDELDRPARTVMATNLRIARETTVIPAGRAPSSIGAASGGAYRRMSVRECSSVQGFPITYQWWGATASLKYKLVGNAVAPPIAYSIARAILAEKQAPLPDRPYVVTRVTDPAPEAALARERTRLLPLDRRFREHVLKVPGHRVDLDDRGDRPAPNPGWTLRGARLRHLVRWRAVHYRGGGKALRHREVSVRDALRLLAATVVDARSAERVRAFIDDLDGTLPGWIPDASTLQAIRAERLTGAVTPYVVLERISGIVARHVADGSAILVHRHAHRERLPAAIAAALVAAAYACELANTSGHWIAAHRDEAYRPARDARHATSVPEPRTLRERFSGLAAGPRAARGVLS